ncbi:hypothetical protein SASPL_133060 [Salvia splendens]|uniref:Protein arginine N-methyltransferase domain-containing protein n=1 Tax=Salvia splendens TaxID=180675 RepID=A0A8X8X475_SALSN|nr:hypothetical protein SASPL_133060 [Salvia splendens]
MFQSTSGGNGSGGGAGLGGDAAFHNGFLHGGGAQLTRTRPRRGTRRRQHDQGGGDSDPRVSQLQEHNDTERPPRPCTDFDVAYFNSYAHLGIHEEMIKVRLLRVINTAFLLLIPGVNVWSLDCNQMHVRLAPTFGFELLNYVKERCEKGSKASNENIHAMVVLDVGCGTGILSIFCAQAGAKRVYAVDASNIAIQNIAVKGERVSNRKQKHYVMTDDNLNLDIGIQKIPAVCWENLKCIYFDNDGFKRGKAANEVIKANNLSDTVIVLHGRVEDVEIDEKVDVIVSEWMGYMLLYESMLGSVITARDRWLKPGGLILPSYATLYMAPVSYPERYSESVDFWRNVYGIDMSAMMPLAKQCAFEEPSVEMISGENVLTWPHVVKHVDCSTLTIEELQTVSTRFTFKSMMRAPFHGFAFWFDVEFGTSSVNTSKSNNAQPALLAAPDDTAKETDKTKKRANPSEGLVLSTAPEAPPTHWQQTLIYFYDPIEVEQDQVIEGSVTLTQSLENARFMNVHLEYSSGGRSFVKESVMR